MLDVVIVFDIAVVVSNFVVDVNVVFSVIEAVLVMRAVVPKGIFPKMRDKNMKFHFQRRSYSCH